VTVAGLTKTLFSSCVLISAKRTPRRFIRLAELPGDLDDVQFVGRPNNAVTAEIDVDGHDSLPDSIGLR
jgi:hypothetical protein